MSNGRFGSGPPDDHDDAPDGPGGLYEAAVHRALRVALPELEAALAAEREEAPRRVRELLAHPLHRQAGLVTFRDRYQSFWAAEHLLERCRRSWSDDPVHAESLAHLALRIADAIEAAGRSSRRAARQRDASAGGPPPSSLNDQRARAWSYVANCRRIRSELAAVPEAFETARHHLLHGAGDPEDEVGILDLEASFFIDRRSFGEAEEALERVIAIYQELGEEHLEGRAMLKLARLRHEQGRGGEAIRLFQGARDKIDSELEPHLDLIVQRGLTLCFAESARFEEALAALGELRRTVQGDMSSSARARVRWIEGLVHYYTGNRERAVAAITEARDGLADAGNHHDTALATLDLARIHLSAGELDRACSLASDLLPLLATGEIAPEPTTAIAAIHRAMERRELTQRNIEDVVMRVRRAFFPLEEPFTSVG